ncbi:hypothetical protein [Leucobacter sp. GX24907]
MSNQSLHELFQGLPDDEPGGQEPQREPREPREPRQRPAALVPWIIVGAVTVVALIVSIMIVTTVRGTDEAEPEPSPVPTTQAPVGPTADPEPSPDPESEDPGDEVPSVEVGSTFTMPIDAWGVSAEVSNKLGSVNYQFSGENNDTLLLSSELIQSLPDSCAAMRSQWGVRKSGNSYEVVKPSERCEDASAVYDEIWGLMDAMVGTIS